MGTCRGSPLGIAVWPASLSVDVAAPVDVHALYSACVLDDGVDDPVVATVGRVQTNQLSSEGFADPPRVLDERAEDELAQAVAIFSGNRCSSRAARAVI